MVGFVRQSYLILSQALCVKNKAKTLREIEHKHTAFPAELPRAWAEVLSSFLILLAYKLTYTNTSNILEGVLISGY